MQYSYEQLIEDVKKEAAALRMNATSVELSKLDLSTFSSNYDSSCIYGQMTGNCYSGRAAKLIKLCAPVLIGSFYEAGEGPEGVENVDAIKEDPFFISNRSNLYTPSRHSPIETYIIMPGAKTANLIAYLKGETDNLDIEL